jgi:hypothetical protein
MGKNNLFILLLFFNTQISAQQMFQIRNPENRIIQFWVIDNKKKTEMLSTPKCELYRVDYNLYKRNIYLINNNEYLLEYTKNDYGLLFKSLDHLDLFLNNNNNLTANIHIEDNKLYYSFWMKSNKLNDFLKMNIKRVEGYESKSGYLLFNIIDMESLIRVKERANGVFDGHWFPDIENFEFFFKNQFVG